jgi:hypothetical protein
MVSKEEITLGCHALIPGYKTEYGYVPTQAAGIAFLALFGASLLLHTVQFCWKRTWWCSVFAVGCISMNYPSSTQWSIHETDHGNSGIDRMGRSDMVIVLSV